MSSLRYGGGNYGTSNRYTRASRGRYSGPEYNARVKAEADAMRARWAAEDEAAKRVEAERIDAIRRDLEEAQS